MLDIRPLHSLFSLCRTNGTILFLHLKFVIFPWRKIHCPGSVSFNVIIATLSCQQWTKVMGVLTKNYTHTHTHSATFCI